MKSLLITISLLSTLTGFAQDHMGLFWKISGNGLEKPSYLYGTMHTSDERVFNFPSSTEKTLEEVDMVALELNMDSINQMSVLSLLIMEDMTLDSLLTEEEYNRVATYFQDSLGTPIAMFNKMMPMYTASMLQVKDLGTQKTEALDMYFAKRGKELGKKIIGLEKVAEQVGAFGSIPYEKQAEGLVEAVEAEYSGEETEMDTDKLMEKYLSGDLDAMYQLTNDYESDDKELQELFMRVFLIERNHRMADRAVPYMEDNSVFIAVGAAHLGGEEGLIELLRAKGYTVEPMK